MTSASYTYRTPLKCETVYTEEEWKRLFSKQIKRKIRQALATTFTLFIFVVLPIVGMFLHWLVVGY